MNPIFIYWFTANLLIIPLSVFVIAPFWVNYSERTINWVYDDVNDEGKKKLNVLRSELTLRFYILPPIITNITVLILYLAFGREPRGSGEYTKNALGVTNGSES